MSDYDDDDDGYGMDRSCSEICIQGFLKSLSSEVAFSKKKIYKT